MQKSYRFFILVAFLFLLKSAKEFLLQSQTPHHYTILSQKVCEQVFVIFFIL